MTQQQTDQLVQQMREYVDLRIADYFREHVDRFEKGVVTKVGDKVTARLNGAVEGTPDISYGETLPVEGDLGLFRRTPAGKRELIRILSRISEGGSSALGVMRNDVLVGTRALLNLLEGTGVVLTAVDDPVTGQVDVTFDASGAGGGTYSGTRVYRTADQTGIADSVDTAVTFQTGSATEEWDTDAYHDPTTNSGKRLKAPSADKYSATGTVRFAATGGGGPRAVWFLKNGTAPYGYQRVRSADTGATHITTTAEIPLAANDYVELWVSQASGGAIDLIADGVNAPAFSLTRLTGGTGPTGPDGPQGIQGVQGIQGIQGTTGNTGAAGAAGAQGIQGVPGSAGATGFSVLSGASVPGGGTGVNGDWYINTTTHDIYGPKAGGAWGSATGLIGPTGAAGSTGPAGPGVPVGGTTGQVLAKINATDYNTQWAAPGSGGAPTTTDYLVGTADAGLSNEIVAGTAPQGELGGTWSAPTVDSTHSGSSHAGIVSTHEGLADPHIGYRLESALIALADMASLAQDQFIGRTTASTGVPQTATITAAARTVLDDTTTALMLATLGGMANPMTTAGDTVYGGTAGAPTRLPGSGSGASASLVQLGTSAPSWLALPREYGCYATHVGTMLSMTSATIDLVHPFDTENYDDEGFHVSGANNARFTIPSGGGRFSLIAFVQWANNATNDRRARFRVTPFAGGVGARYNLSAARVRAGATGGSGLVIAAEADFSGGDYIEVECYQDSGATISTTAASFWIRRIIIYG